MSFSFATMGNDLYTGKKSVPVVPHRRRFYLALLQSGRISPETPSNAPSTSSATRRRA